jgi:stearoyl-CoA desaturase (delta-9 desaturase)
VSVASSLRLMLDTHAADPAAGLTPEQASRFDPLRTLPFALIHVACFAAIWTGVSWTAVLVALGMYWLRMFAITGFYHRYFSHRTFKTNRFWQFVFAVIGNMAVQRGALWWAAHHRHHHKYSDEPNDAHSPKQSGFWWSHCFWFTCKANFRTQTESIPDLMKFPELVLLDRFDWAVPVLLGVGMFGLGHGLSVWAPQLGTNGWQMFIWGFCISTVITAHATFTINSLCHVWGNRRFETTDTSRNNIWLALLTLGEGWHNNHHHYQSSTRQGFYWYEIDITFYILTAMSWVGIVRDLKSVPDSVLAAGGKPGPVPGA